MTDTLPQTYEYPLPKLAVSGGKLINDKLIIETTREGTSGELVLKNAGGQLLEGKLISTSPLLGLCAESFSSNQFRLTYKVSPRNNLISCKIGEIIHASIIISSSGGEKIVPVIIKIVPHALELDGASIRSLKDFAVYARKQPQAAAKALTVDTFSTWLVELDSTYFDIYEQLRKAPNIRQSLEVFLVLHKLKNPVTLSVSGDTFEHEIIENSTAPVFGSITITRSLWGYFEQDIRVRYGSAWLQPSKPIITEDDFDGGNTASFSYTIDPTQIYSGRVSDKIMIGNEVEFSVKVKASPSFVCHIPSAFLKSGSRGTLVVRNLSGAPARLELFTSDSFIRLDTKETMLAAGNSELGFTAKLSPIQSAQMLIKKQPTLSGEVHVRITQGERVFTKNLSITIGEID